MDHGFITHKMRLSRTGHTQTGVTVPPQPHPQNSDSQTTQRGTKLSKQLNHTPPTSKIILTRTFQHRAKRTPSRYPPSVVFSTFRTLMGHSRGSVFRTGAGKSRARTAIRKYTTTRTHSQTTGVIPSSARSRAKWSTNSINRQNRSLHRR